MERRTTRRQNDVNVDRISRKSGKELRKDPYIEQLEEEQHRHEELLDRIYDSGHDVDETEVSTPITEFDEPVTPTTERTPVVEPEPEPTRNITTNSAQSEKSTTPTTYHMGLDADDKGTPFQREVSQRRKSRVSEPAVTPPVVTRQVERIEDDDEVHRNKWMIPTAIATTCLAIGGLLGVGIQRAHNNEPSTAPVTPSAAITTTQHDVKTVVSVPPPVTTTATVTSTSKPAPVTTTVTSTATATATDNKTTTTTQTTTATTTTTAPPVTSTATVTETASPTSN